MQQNYHRRAQRITDRLMPPRPVHHGFLDPVAFWNDVHHRAIASRVFWIIKARLRAKAEGGRPVIRLPKSSRHLFGPGNAMFDVARYLEEQAA